MTRFSGYILLFDAVCLLLAGILLWLLDASETFGAVLLAFAITTVLAVSSYYPFARIKNGDMNKYLSAMLLGMAIRMIFIGASVVVVFLFTELNQIAFTVALLFSYICKSAVETYILTRKHRYSNT
ncbi:MAG: ATP synthase subunit I [Cyclonatronaceae bacterium]